MNHDNSQTLLIDADDTLWENNIYFERVIRMTQERLEPFGIDPGIFREHLNATERRHIPIHGYGTENFTRSLVETSEFFLTEDAREDLVARVREDALAIMRHPIEILPGVQETLTYLASRHALYLVTKGDPAEQSRKIEASGLRRHFIKIEILADKNQQVFRNLLAKHGWNPLRTWMIGNSPRSDINPAIAAGIKAVYIPHPHTWILEHDEPVDHPNVISVERFADLYHHF